MLLDKESIFIYMNLFFKQSTFALMFCYFQATFEIQTESISEGTRVLIVDDLLATGGLYRYQNEVIDLSHISETWTSTRCYFVRNDKIILTILHSIGTMEAAVKLLKDTGAIIVECLVVMELTALKGRYKIGIPVHSFIKYD